MNGRTLFWMQPFSNFTIWNIKNKRYLLAKFIIANCISLLLIIGFVYYFFSIKIENERDRLLFLEIQKRFPYYYYLIALGISSGLLLLGLFIKKLKISKLHLYVSLLTFALGPLFAVFCVTQFAYGTISVMARTMTEARNRDSEEVTIDPPEGTLFSLYGREISDEEKIEMAKRDTKRARDMARMSKALMKYKADHGGVLPMGISDTEQTISSEGINLCRDFVPTYLQELPIDPSVGGVNTGITNCDEPYNSEYTVMINYDGLVQFSSHKQETRSDAFPIVSIEKEPESESSKQLDQLLERYK